MRGKLRPALGKQKCLRNIPAYAGKTKTCTWEAEMSPEHPRVCGENVALVWGVPHVSGTSPRIRGKRFGAAADHPTHRNIPAYTGKTIKEAAEGLKEPEHPRVYGENTHEAIITDSPPGTSPRIRGKRGHPLAKKPRTRNIPAYTGKTVCHLVTPASTQEHPRVYGENAWNQAYLWRRSGTSPRIRGKPHADDTQVVTTRNIPAYAGKTVATQSISSKSTEHPRVCGENHGVLLGLQAPNGTSPRMRGKLFR